MLQKVFIDFQRFESMTFFAFYLRRFEWNELSFDIPLNYISAVHFPRDFCILQMLHEWKKREN